MKTVIPCLSLFFILIFSTLSPAAEIYTLEDLYRIALKRSEKVMISEQRLYMAERQKDKAISVLLPWLSSFGEYKKYNEEKTRDSTFIIQPSSASSWGLKLERSFSLGGKEFYALRMAQENTVKARFDLTTEKESLLFNVASAYYELLRAKEAVEIAKANVERLKKHRDAAEARLKVGEVTKTALLRAEAELSSARSEFVRASNNLKLAKAILSRVVGIEGDYDVAESKPDIEEQPEMPDVSHYKEIAFSKRPELKSAELQKVISEHRVKYTEGSYFPNLKLEADYVRNETDPSTFSLIKEQIYGIVRIEFPIFEGGLRRAELRESIAQKKEAELFYEDLKKNVGIEVEESYLEVITLRETIKFLEDEVKFAKENYRAVSKQFEFGLADSVDVMDANTLLLTAEKNLSNAKYNYQLSLLRLRRATGTLLEMARVE
uniref:Outer membrane efflux protein n=1 Tax=uncultured prokaryote TaxID=198431 RepID=H5SEL3_9ZZZZ|nr:outer membrane efflux protein [uncultured prokaryote]